MYFDKPGKENTQHALKLAADAGALSGNDLIAIGGSGRGADAALVLKPAHQNNFFDMRIKEVICKPRSF